MVMIPVQNGPEFQSCPRGEGASWIGGEIVLTQAARKSLGSDSWIP